MSSLFLEKLNDRVLLGDGAMGTEIYKRGIFINRCYDELNLTNPDLIRQIHVDYIKAGADIIETNTFLANPVHLAAYGLDQKTKDIVTAGVKLAREAVGKREVFVAGAVGPLVRHLAPIGRVSLDEARAAFREQIGAMVDAGVDVILLETFTSIRELELVYKVAREISKTPIIAQLAFSDSTDATPEEAVAQFEKWGVDVAGTNCANGPQVVWSIIQRMRAVSTMKLSAMPNAGMPQVVEGRTMYLATPEYMAEYARRIVQSGANIIGGCCGTTPADIAEMRNFLKAITGARVAPSTGKAVGVSPSTPHVGLVDMSPVPLAEKSPFGAVLGKKFAVSVELDPPHGLDPSKVIEAAKFLHAQGIDACNIADGPRAIARMSPMSLASLIKQHVGLQTIVHYCCRDRNLLGMQMDLIGANAMDLNNVLIITGDPPKMGNYPAATAVFDVDAIGLLHFANGLNHGRDLAGKSLGAPTKLVLGCGCNPGAVNLDVEVERYVKKVEAGAEYVFSQPVYDPAMLEEFLKRTAHVKPIPFFVGILPLASLKNAEFFHNEIPGMQIPDAIMKRMASVSSKEGQQQEGIAIAREALAAAKKMPRVQGTYIFPPFGNYKAVMDVLEVI
jgi:homocysteine S-methyltransferase